MVPKGVFPGEVDNVGFHSFREWHRSNDMGWQGEKPGQYMP